MFEVEVIIRSLENNPWCPHGPTLLFSRKINGEKRNFFACSACRDRKLCPFYLEEQDRDKYKSKVWKAERKKFVGNINHIKLFSIYNQISQLPSTDRVYCFTCNAFQLKQFWAKHDNHNFITNITDHQLKNPSKFLPALEDTKKEAQFLFSSTSVNVIVDIFKQLKYSKVISIGTPRIHEFILNQQEKMTSLLLDFDSRYHNFCGPLQFCWYNCFNNHFFLPQAEQVFRDFLEGDSDEHVLVIDPPFGGRVEPLAYTIQAITETYKEINKSDQKLSVFWIFPYFMEPHILNCLPNFQMLDYKVEYENHPLFQNALKARKYGSPVRIFTNVNPSEIVLPTDGYKFCSICAKWVSQENQHCLICKNCTSKDGRTYVHCNRCKRCVKPTWLHCSECNRCCQPNHKCGTFEFLQNCFHCNESGHKKRDCPKVDHNTLHIKRKLKIKTKPKKRLKK